ncbi:hypothetical protein PSN_4709 [Pseudomonas sp. NGC7]
MHVFKASASAKLKTAFSPGSSDMTSRSSISGKARPCRANPPDVKYSMA